MLLRVKSWKILIPQRCYQALYVRRENLEGNLRAVEPTYDFKKRLTNRKDIEQMLKRRGLESINLSELYKQWQRYKDADKKRRSIIPRCRYWKSILDGELVESIITMDMAKQKLCNANNDMQNAIDELEMIEENFLPIYLTLPNDLLPKTPNEKEIISIYGNQYNIDAKKCHLNADDSIEFVNESAYYLKGAAAKFDLLFPMKCTDHFRQNGFTLFNNPDFTKTVIIEGAAVPLDDTFLVPHHFDERFTNLVHLIGNGSMLSFLGSLANIIFDFSLMPMHWTATGKIYQPIKEVSQSETSGLLNVCQSTAVQIFLVGTNKQMQKEYDRVIELICDIYKELNMHFRVVNIPANELNASECFATAIEMYSPALESFIEVGRISNYGEFISRRLNIHSDGDGKCGGQKPNIIAANVCNVTKLIAIILETHHGQFPNNLIN